MKEIWDLINFQIYKFYQMRGETTPEVSASAYAPALAVLNVFSIIFIAQIWLPTLRVPYKQILLFGYLPSAALNYWYLCWSDRYIEIFNTFYRKRENIHTLERYCRWYIFSTLLLWFASLMIWVGIFLIRRN